MPPPVRLLAIATLFLTAMPAMAARVGSVRITGLDEAMTENVRVSLSLEDAAAAGKDVSGRRMAYLVQVAEDETREALEPFGYYTPTINVQRTRRADGATDIVIAVDKGEPVRVRGFDVGVDGPGAEDRALKQDLAAFAPQPGAVFDHTVYEDSKAQITRRLAARGFFDADFSEHKVEVTRALHAADIALRWSSGDRYALGAVEFNQTPPILRDALLQKLVRWKAGDPYNQVRLDGLRQSLSSLDYFSSIDVRPRVRRATAGADGVKRVPVRVTLTPAKRSIYTYGVSYGTDSGAGVRMGVERRYVNSRGHKALAQLDYAQKRKTLTLQYRVPAFAWRDGWYTASLQGSDEQTDYIDDRLIEFVASRSGQYSRRINLVAALHALRERWAYAYEDDNDPGTPKLYSTATFVYPSLSAQYNGANDRLYPTRGIAGSLDLLGGLQSAGSDASFAQAHARARWYLGLGENNRLIVRGELGHTFTDALTALPPTLRFYAGGDNSIRGYNWREVGPRVRSGPHNDEFALGAKNVTTASVEFEHYLANGWGGAVFVDTGSAFDDQPDWHAGVGFGVRWKSPVGPVKVDLARGLDHPDSPLTIGLSIGADLP